MARHRRLLSITRTLPLPRIFLPPPLPIHTPEPHRPQTTTARVRTSPSTTTRCTPTSPPYRVRGRVARVPPPMLRRHPHRHPHHSHPQPHPQPHLHLPTFPPTGCERRSTYQKACNSTGEGRRGAEYAKRLAKLAKQVLGRDEIESMLRISTWSIFEAWSAT
ncbi:hypothetical protein B0H14DRAFT_229433 [Mycena olivaceomarginata]|nr:hypothetical protein B0H14DRAFT_229433 [Mycena olivaceomarginata]